jgi:phage terminase small subunit
MVNDALLSHEARAIGMHEDPEIRAKVDGLARRLAVEELEKREIEQAAQPTEEELQEVYQREYERLNLRVVTVRDREQAQEILEQIRDGADMAAARCPSIRTGTRPVSSRGCTTAT